MQEAEMPTRRDRLALFRRLLLAVEGGDHRLERRPGDDVLILDLGAELFLAQRFDVDRHGASSNVASPA